VELRWGDKPVHPERYDDTTLPNGRVYVPPLVRGVKFVDTIIYAGLEITE